MKTKKKREHHKRCKMAFSTFLFSEPVEKQTHFGIFKCKMAVGHDCSALNPKFKSLRGKAFSRES